MAEVSGSTRDDDSDAEGKMFLIKEVSLSPMDGGRFLRSFEPGAAASCGVEVKGGAVDVAEDTEEEEDGGKDRIGGRGCAREEVSGVANTAAEGAVDG